MVVVSNTLVTPVTTFESEPYTAPISVSYISQALVPSLINPSTATTTLTGTSAGSAIWVMPYQGSGYKKFLVYLNGYENTTATAQTITFPVAFTYTPNVSTSISGVSASTTALTLPASQSAAVSGWIIVEGF